MASARAGRLALVLSGLMVLVACEPGQGFNPFGASQNGAPAAGVANASSSNAVGQEIESPETLQITDSGLWDGRPSLGGVWVAHPDVIDPERVLIRNQDNGRSIVGALFRRERENPGPLFQVSSDAAAELGMLAGAPSALSVVALVRVKAPVVVEPAPVVVPDIAETVAAETAAVIGTPETVEASPIEPAVPIASIAAAAIEAATAKNPTASLPEAATASETAAVTPVARPAAAPVQTGAPLSALAKPFIQIGIFSVESNADDTSDALRSAGIIPTTKTSQSNGKTYWRVLIGPIGSTSDHAALLTKIKDLGYTDAYAVTN